MSTFVIVPGAWDTPAVMDPLVAPLEAAGHAATVVDLRCDDPDANLEDYAVAARGALPEDLADVVLVGYSFGGFDREDYNVSWNMAIETGGVLVGKHVQLELEVQAVPKE